MIVFGADVSRFGGRHRRIVKGRVRVGECRLRSLPALEPVVPCYALHVGRVGASAVALGVGSALAAIPSAFADTSGSSGASVSAGASGGSVAAGRAVRRLPMWWQVAVLDSGSADGTPGTNGQNGAV